MNKQNGNLSEEVGKAQRKSVVSVDHLILGSGLVECALACILSSEGKKVLIVDTSPVYGSELGTLKYSELEAFYQTGVIDPVLKGLDQSFNIDLTPKLLLADSSMTKLILKYKIEDYLDFVSIPGSFIFKERLHSVPTNETESMTTSVISIWQKPRVMKFFWDVRGYAKGKKEDYPFKATMREEFQGYGLSSETVEYIGHAIALNLDDSYLDRHPKETFDKIVLYVKSIVSYDDSLRSPYIYPMYGISEIVQGFARVACIKGAEVMLNARILKVDYEKKKASVVEPVEGEEVEVEARNIISGYSITQSQLANGTCEGTCGPSTGTGKEIIKGLCIVEEGAEIINKAKSSQVIFLKGGLGRKSDIFVVVLGEDSMTCPRGYKVVMISTVKETEDPEGEIRPVLEKLGRIRKFFLDVKVVYEREEMEGVYFTRGVDETTHFETLYEEIEEIRKKIAIGSVMKEE